jgi:hypothetical protein
MKRILVAFVALLFLGGCINITEEVFLEKDGSGKYVMTLDMEKMMEMMEMAKAFAPDSLQDQSLDLNMMDSLENAMGDLSTVPGITEFTKGKKDKNTYEISFRFKDIRALNEAMRKRNQKATATEDAYAFNPGTFEFRDTTSFGLNNIMKELDQSQTDSVMAAMEMMRTIMGDMTYNTIYHFPGKVTNFTNKNATLDPDGKTLRLQVNLFDKENSITLRNKVSYEK